MLNDNIPTDVKEIDLSQIDWSCLTIPEFNKIEAKLIADKKMTKLLKSHEKRSSGTITVILLGKSYTIKETLYTRLKEMKSEKSREKLVKEIISTHNPIIDL